MTTERCIANQWLSRACQLFRDFTTRANVLMFTEIATHSDTKFGDVIAITSKTLNVNLSECLIRQNVAIDETADIFKQHYTRAISQTAERWYDDKFFRNDIEEKCTVQSPRSFSLLKNLVQNTKDYPEMNYKTKVLDWKERNERSLKDNEEENFVSEDDCLPVQTSDEIKSKLTNLESSIKDDALETNKEYYRIAFQPNKVPSREKPIFLAAGNDLAQYFKKSQLTVDSPAEKVVCDIKKLHEDWIPKGYTETEPLTEVITTNFNFKQSMNEDIR